MSYLELDDPARYLAPDDPVSPLEQGDLAHCLVPDDPVSCLELDDPVDCLAQDDPLSHLVLDDMAPGDPVPGGMVVSVPEPGGAMVPFWCPAPDGACPASAGRTRHCCPAWHLMKNGRYCTSLYRPLVLT